MGDCYGQLSLAERIEIYRLHADGKSLRSIAVLLGRSASTIMREIRRNSVRTKRWPGGYDPVRADHLAERRRRWDCRFKLARQPDLCRLVKDRLAMGWSPAQIAGRLALDPHSITISHESIYRFIYHRVAQKDHGWHSLLPNRRYYRGRRHNQGGPPSKTFTDYVSIDQRPAEIAKRNTPGHWEADLMAFNHNKRVILIAQERLSRKLFGGLQPNKSAAATRQRLQHHLKPLPDAMRQSITYDNGTEFAQHHRLNQAIGTKSYFCHTKSPWEKGGIENAIGRLRRFLPRKTSPEKLTPQAIATAIQKYNNTPRKCLNFLTANEAFDTCYKSSTVALQT